MSVDPISESLDDNLESGADTISIRRRTNVETGRGDVEVVVTAKGVPGGLHPAPELDAEIRRIANQLLDLIHGAQPACDVKTTKASADEA